PIDTGPSPGSLDVKGTIVSMPMAFEADGDPGLEAVFLVSDGDTSWMYLVGHARADEIQGGFITGDGVFGIVITSGRVIAHPVLCVDESSTYAGGFCTAATGPDGYLRFIHIELTYDSAVPGLALTSWSMTGSYGSEDLLLPASGDIDGNGIDDMVMAMPGGDLVYFDIGRGAESSAAGFERPSPPSLADIDGDGILETLIRDRDGLFLLTGYGTTVSGWPVELEDHLVILEPDTTPAQPAAADVDGDGDLEAVFNVAGELRAYRYDARLVDGWPLRGEGDHSITPAISRGAGSQMFIFTAGGSGGIAGPDQAGTVFFPGFSTMTRIDPGMPWDGTGAWPAYRMDARGTSRQLKPEGDISSGPLADESSMICYPNPATGNSFNVRLSVSGMADVTVRLFNLEGTEVYSSTSKHEWTGGGVPFEMSVPTAGLASGIYLCHVRVQGGGEDWSGSKKVAILK
ncbi:MAG: T9SS type A sorting domain-containing protein, partial [Candidatus Krumholzibacteria bacterium]|nr:T9SS type A sorting domain-containing protein [Candidatus Krumholzibacteria bacterium]